MWLASIHSSWSAGGSGRNRRASRSVVSASRPRSFGSPISPNSFTAARRPQHDVERGDEPPPGRRDPLEREHEQLEARERGVADRAGDARARDDEPAELLDHDELLGELGVRLALREQHAQERRGLRIGGAEDAQELLARRQLLEGRGSQIDRVRGGRHRERGTGEERGVSAMLAPLVRGRCGTCGCLSEIRGRRAS